MASPNSRNFLHESVDYSTVVGQGRAGRQRRQASKQAVSERELSFQIHPNCRFPPRKIEGKERKKKRKSNTRNTQFRRNKKWHGREKGMDGWL